MKQILQDFRLTSENVPMYCDKTSAIRLSKNPIQHFKVMYIKLRHHFVRNQVQNGNIFVEYVGINDQLADIFTNNEDPF